MSARNPGYPGCACRMERDSRSRKNRKRRDGANSEQALHGRRCLRRQMGTARQKLRSNANPRIKGKEPVSEERLGQRHFGPKGRLEEERPGINTLLPTEANWDSR